MIVLSAMALYISSFYTKLPSATTTAVTMAAVVVGRATLKAETTIEVMGYLAQAQKTEFEAIKALSELRETLEGRITSILSDYTQMINQASVVSTLTLGMATAAFGSLLGNTDDQPEWKSTMFAMSCVITVCLSLMSVIESFFLGVHINQVEARFAGGVYPHINGGDLRKFDPEELKNLNAKFNFVVVTFFASFLSFSTTVLGTMYIGLGLSDSVFEHDGRIINKGDLFVNDPRFNATGHAPLYNIEPNYVQTATTMTVIVGLTYFVILFRFFATYSRHIYGKSLLRFLVICGCMQPHGEDEDEDLLTPIEAAAERFNLLQEHITKRCTTWLLSSMNLTLVIANFSFNEFSVFDEKNIPKEFSAGGEVPAYKDQNFFRKTISNVSLWSNKLFDMLENATLTSTDIWSTAPKIKKAHACKNHIAELKTNITVIERYQLSESAEPLAKLSYNMKPWARIIVFAILVWSISGGVVVTILFFVLGILLTVLVNMCTCCRGSCWTPCGREKLDSMTSIIRRMTTSHFNCLYKVYKKQIEIERPSSINTTGPTDEASSSMTTGSNPLWKHDAGLYRRTYAGKDYSLIKF